MSYQHSARIATRFGARAASYDRDADLQRAVAARLATLLPELKVPRVLEIGCGTGLFSRHLVERYPDGDILLTDIAPEMLAQARAGLGHVRNVRFELADGESPGVSGPFDLIALSMTLHWFAEPRAALDRLRALLAPGGTLIYACIGPGSFAEWAEALDALHLPNGLVNLPPLPGIVAEDVLKPDADALGFMRRIKAIGGATPRPGYAALPPGALRRAIRALDAAHDGVSWHIVYGRLDAN